MEVLYNITIKGWNMATKQQRNTNKSLRIIANLVRFKESIVLKILETTKFQCKTTIQMGSYMDNNINIVNGIWSPNIVIMYTV